MSETGLSSAWRGTSASLRGSSHGSDGINQDAVCMQEVAGGAGTSTWVVAVSDGHGGSRYVRSDTGSQVAVSVAVAEVAELLAGGHPFGSDLLRDAAPVIVEAWRAGVLAHLASNPFTEDEAAQAGTALYGNPLVAYGATLLVAAISDTGVLLAQIGDGDALVRTHGFAVRPVPGDLRLVANETTSLCMDTAVEDFRFADLPGSAEVDLVLLSTDGYGNSFAAQDWWHKLIGDLAWFVDVHGFDEFAARLPEWLAESALVGGDDVTAAVVTRPPAVHVPATLVIDEPIVEADESSAEQAGPPPVRPSRPGRRALVTVLLVALLVAAAVFGGARLFTGNDAPSDVVTPSQTPSDAGTPDSPDEGAEPRPPRGNQPADPGNGGPNSPPSSGSKAGGKPKP